MSNQQSIEGQFCQAGSGNFVEVQRLLAAGIDPNSKDSFGYTALMSTKENLNAGVRHFLHSAASVW